MTTRTVLPPLPAATPAVVVVGLCLTLSAAKCSGPAPDDPYVPPAITTVAVKPDAGVADDGDVIELRIDAWDADGNYIWIEDQPAVTVEWSAHLEPEPGLGPPPGPAPYDLSATTGSAISVEIQAPLPLPLVVTAVVTTSGANLTAAARFEGPTTSVVAADRITAINTSGSAIAMLDACAFDGSVAAPVHGLLYEFFKQQDLAENLTENGCSRNAEFAVLSREHRMLFRDAASYTGGPVWTNTVGDELLIDKPEQWLDPDVIDVYVHFFINGAGSVHAQRVETLVHKANVLFTNNRLGLRLQAMPPTFGSDQVGECKIPLIEDELGIPLDDNRLHVVFVRTVLLGNGSHVSGLTCRDFGTGGRVIFIDWDLIDDESLLPHEIGHVLGHKQPYLPFHHPTALTPGFAKSNLMFEKTYDANREWLTVGQVYRMNVDQASWYQHEPMVTPHPARDCGCEPYLQEVCPRLDRNPGVAPLPASVNYCSKLPTP